MTEDDVIIFPFSIGSYTVCIFLLVIWFIVINSNETDESHHCGFCNLSEKFLSMIAIRHSFFLSFIH